VIAIIPTIYDKIPWLARTLKGIALQTAKPDRVEVMVDVKPWDPQVWAPGLDDDSFKAIVPDGLDVHFSMVGPPLETKRQHAMINDAVQATDADTIIIMDDDYWMTEVDCFAKLVAEVTDGRIAIPESILEVTQSSVGSWLAQPLIHKDGTIRYFSRVPEAAIVQTCHSRRGQNVMCGHPKIMSRNDFIAVGGFDTKSFRHYWWCDTDMYYRLRQRAAFVVKPMMIYHVDHGRRSPKMFEKENAMAFLAKHGRTAIDPRHMEIIDSIIKDAT
jgi:hypothetical protein